MRPDAPDNMHADEPRRDGGKTAATKDPGTRPKGDTTPVATPAKTEKTSPREPEVYSRTPVPSKPAADAESAMPKPAEKPVDVTPAEGDPRNDGNPSKGEKPVDVTPALGDPRKDASDRNLVKDEKPVNATPLETEPKDKTADEKPTGVHARTPLAADPAVGAPALGRAAVVHSDDRDPLLAKETRDDLQDRWQALQLRFIDDPRNVAKDAGSLVEESLEQLRTALNDRKRELDDWNAEGTVDTERLRRVVCDYRELFDNVLGH